MTSLAWGGARPGAGRRRSTVTLRMPPEVIKQLEEIAKAEHAPIEDVVKEAILSYLEQWQSEHESAESH